MPWTRTRPRDAVPMFRDNWRLRLHSSRPVARSKGSKLSAILPAGGRVATADHYQQHLPQPFPTIAAAPMGQAWQLYGQNAGGLFRCSAAVVPCASVSRHGAAFARAGTWNAINHSDNCREICRVKRRHVGGFRDGKGQPERLASGTAHLPRPHIQTAKMPQL